MDLARFFAMVRRGSGPVAGVERRRELLGCGNVALLQMKGRVMSNVVRFSAIAGALLALAPLAPLAAQQYGRPQDGFVSLQYSGQYSGQYNGRVDGRVNRNEGFPPSAADKRAWTNFGDPYDCVEVSFLAADAHTHWQSRLRRACQDAGYYY